MQRIWVVILVLLLFSHVTYARDRAEVVEKFVDAFNQRDIDAMLDLSVEDLRWMRISGDSISIETSSTAALREAMLGYFKSIPSARSKVRSIKESGPFVYALEEASWLSDGITKNQCSIAVYELKNNKIKNVWYFPEHSCKQE